MHRFSARRDAVRGFTAIELLVAMVISVIAMLFAGSLSVRLYHRYKMVAVVREVNALVLATRMQAVKHNRQVVLFVDLANRRLVSWADDLPYNYIQDATEPTINSYQFPSFVVFRDRYGSVNGAPAVAFDTYNGDTSLDDRIVFQGDGTLVPPQDLGSKPPDTPAVYTANVPHGSVDCQPTGCRGIYLVDRPNGGPDRNLFRVSVDGRSGRVSVLKYLAKSQGGNPGDKNFVPPPWKWVD